ncbi:hypothetical protein WA026_001685 [Henosepilachna vigintioctopunctata]|uniref:Phorbol-ester/DAG-type domain-containing protein n=1 Tax=Henosepilachna vigintioctopunctata TaxID=420089 RepID=A0AAW1URP4_9CUCU
MSSNKNVDVSVAPQIDSYKCGQCRQSVVKSGLKCILCSKVYHPRCGGRVKMCCGEELTNPLTCEPNSEQTAHNIVLSKTLKVSSESSKEELLLKLIEELEAKNLILLENSLLLKYKISKLEDEACIKNGEITNLKKRVNNLETRLNASDDYRKKRDESKIVRTSAPIKSAVTDDRGVPTNSSNDLEDVSTSLALHTKDSEKLFTIADVGTVIASARESYSLAKENVHSVKESKNDNENMHTKYEWRQDSRKRSRKSSGRTLVVGYEQADYFCRPPKKHGGTMIYVKSGLQISPLDISRFSEEVHCEVCGIRVTTQNQYCSARTDVMFLCGDLNVNYLDSCSNDRKLLSDLLGCFNLTVSSLLPTRVFLNSVGKTTSAKLDYVLTNAERDQFEVEVVEANLSDHKIIKLDLLSVFLLPLPISSPLKSVRIINDSSLNSFVTMLASTDFAALYSNSDIDIIFKIFSDLLQSAMYECIPLKNVRNKQSWRNVDRVERLHTVQTGSDSELQTSCIKLPLKAISQRPFDSL